MQPDPTSGTPPRPPAPARRRTVPRITAWLPLLGVALAAALAWLLSQVWSGAPVVVAALSAAVGVLVVAAPLAWLVRHALQPLQQAMRAGPPPAAAVPGPGFLDRATRELARARRHEHGAALLLVDVDVPAGLSDELIPGYVDRALRALMQQTEPSLRSADLLTRFTATQLAVLLSPADLLGTLDVAERIRERAELIEITVTATGQCLRVSVSVGAAQLRPVPADLHSLIDDAGLGVQAARLAGGNCVRTAPADAGPQRLPGPRDPRRAQPK